MKKKIISFILSLSIIFAAIPLYGMTFPAENGSAYDHEAGSPPGDFGFEAGGERPVGPGLPEGAYTGEGKINETAAYVWSGSSPPAVTDGAAVTISGSPSGTLVVPANASVAIEGAVSEATAGLTLNLGLGASVRWNAEFTGAPGANLITLTGGGSLYITSEIINTGAGGALRIEGAGSRVTVGEGGRVASDTGGIGIVIAAKNVSFTISEGGVAESMSGNSNPAVQVNNGITGASITVDGGEVVSATSGYGILDGSGTSAVENNTVITVNSGAVTAGNACAIRSSGADSVIIINGGKVSGSASNNLNPVVYMIGSPDARIYMNGGVVRAVTNSAYAVQTAGDIFVEGGLISSVAGRAINLIGLYSTATVNGGAVRATGTNGIAICTATTNIGTVLNTSVVINGGEVTATNGSAVNITGDSSSVTINGGDVSTLTGKTINSSGVNAVIKINGGKVSGTTGSTVNVTGANTSVTVNGGQVSATSGFAISAVGVTVPVTLGGGLIFAYGTNTESVVLANAISGLLPGGGMLAAWNSAKGARSYPRGNRDDLYGNPGIGVTDFFWYDHPTLGGGIEYKNGANTGFFPLNSVTVTYDPPVTRAINVTVANSVSGDFADTTKAFVFTIYFTDGGGKMLRPGEAFEFEGGAIPETGAEAPDGGILILGEDAEAAFSLKHGQTITVKEVPADLMIRIETAPHGIYRTSFKYGEDNDFTAGGDTGYRIAGLNDRMLDFINERLAPPPMGINGGARHINILLLLSGLLTLPGAVFLKRRSNN